MLRNENKTPRAVSTYESDISDEFGASSGGEVDTSSVLGGGLVSEEVDVLLLEELVTTELESTLEEVTGGCRTKASEESTSTLRLNDLAETTDHTPVVGGRVELDSGLDAAETELLANDAIWRSTRVRCHHGTRVLGVPGLPGPTILDRLGICRKEWKKLTHRRE